MNEMKKMKMLKYIINMKNRIEENQGGIRYGVGWWSGRLSCLKNLNIVNI